MARCNKKADSNVMVRLGEIALRAVRKVGIYHSRGRRGGGQQQTGIIRTNCVDCLDRTNTAQFSVGLCALGFQVKTIKRPPYCRMSGSIDKRADIA